MFKFTFVFSGQEGVYGFALGFCEVCILVELVGLPAFKQGCLVVGVLCEQGIQGVVFEAVHAQFEGFFDSLDGAGLCDEGEELLCGLVFFLHLSFSFLPWHGEKAVIGWRWCGVNRRGPEIFCFREK